LAAGGTARRLSFIKSWYKKALRKKETRKFCEVARASNGQRFCFFLQKEDFVPDWGRMNAAFICFQARQRHSRQPQTATQGPRIIGCPSPASSRLQGGESALFHSV